MANGKFEMTHEKIMESGKTLFLKNGYERTNLRELCKEAGVTTGAFYRHFDDKAALFSALVDPVIEGLKNRYETAAEECFNFASVKELEQMWTVSQDAMDEIIKYIFQYFDQFKLLLCCSDGTKYVDFIDWMVEREVADSIKIDEILKEKNINVNSLSEKEMHMLYHSFYSCIFETVYHDYTLDEALECTAALSKFYTAGWKEAHGL